MLEKFKKRYFARAVLHTAGQSNQVGINRGLIWIGIGLGAAITSILLILLYIMLPEFYFVVFTVPTLFVFWILGGTHFFRLSAEEILCYCAFNDSVKYAKNFVHQVHCGTSYGKSLIDYVVPEENRKKCFFSGKKIKSGSISMS